jgi:hypothetical protein
MLARLTVTLRNNMIAILALFLAAGGGYALAASHSATIHGCVVKRTGALLIKNRCGRGQRRIAWNQQGPQGAQGPQGPQGASAVNVWAAVDDAGNVIAGQGISVSRISAGTYEVTAAACANKPNAPTVSVSDANPPAGQGAGAFPVGWVEGSANQQFNVVTGVVAGGAFTATDHTFYIHDSC